MGDFLELYAPIIAVVSAITTLLSYPIGFLFGGKSSQKQALKKEVAATKQTDADANVRIAESYRQFVEDHNNQMQVLREDQKELRSSNMAISAKQTDILLLYTEEQRKSNELEKKNIELTRKLKENEKKNTELTQKVDELERQIALLTGAKTKTK